MTQTGTEPQSGAETSTGTDPETGTVPVTVESAFSELPPRSRLIAEALHAA
ncbi:hypothetical protein [Frankia gtarii]|uniref:hypothetical protein n=1 Tax=Frankia gtarii TaxID=2950102 RepID=UPI0021BF8159|nr:hypothetical protein [Frankia gtarii]